MRGTAVVVHASSGPFLLALDAAGPIGLREDGPLAGRALVRARVVGRDADGREVPVQSAAGERHLILYPEPGMERYELRYGRGKAGRAGNSSPGTGRNE
jgi:hypothetical protein